MTDVGSIFDALGGTTASARVMAVNQSTASEMRRRGSIPVTYWPSIIEEAVRLSLPISYETLVEVHASRRPRVPS